MMRWTGFWALALIAGTATAQQTEGFATSARELALRQREGLAGSVESDALMRLYESPGVRPLWTTIGKGPTPQARDAMRVLETADARGLPVDSADVELLWTLAVEAGKGAEAAARFDVALSRSMIQFVSALRVGRIDPATLGLESPNVVDRTQLATLVTDVATATDVPDAIRSLEPPYAGYVALARTLARYRTLAADTTLRPPPRARSTIRPGDRYADLAALTRLLRALGDLSAGDTIEVARATPDTTAALYTGALVDAVRSFQRRHGLDADGAIGPATMTELHVPLSQRVRQIEITLERWRWLPRRAPRRYIVVNVAAFRLFAFEDDSTAERPALAMNVIAGNVAGHKTPVFSATMQEVVFLPFWDVPPKIARTELVPTFRRRPRYFYSENFEIVRPGTTAVDAPTFSLTDANLARVASGQLRVRQRPGASNALGFIKFIFPNPYNVFLHDTPTRELFGNTRRDFSHGCIRIAGPNDLAEFVLRGQPSWDRTAVDSVARGSATVRVPLARPVPVFVVYATAAAASDGTVSFYPDLYKHDVVLERALGLSPVVRR